MQNNERPAAIDPDPSRIASSDDWMQLQHALETQKKRIVALEQQVAGMVQQEDALAYGISHDLRAPVRAIDGFAKALEHLLPDDADPQAIDYLQRMRAASARMGGLIDGLLELSRASRAELRMQDVDASMLAEWVGAELQDADPQRSAQTNVQPDMHVHGDERQLKALLSELMRNAWQFSAARDQVRIEVSGERVGERMLLRVRDHGSGFDMAHADKLFQPFQRLHSADDGAGNGLGLAIAQRIAQRHGGSIRAERSDDAGSSFVIDLPATG